MARARRTNRGTVTILDVARAADVSTMTVSRVMNGAANVRDETRARVLEAIAQLNYSPNMAARSLAAGHATHIGLLYANPSDAYLTQFLVGALEGARQAGCHLALEVCDGETAEAQAGATRRFASTNVEGVILAPPVSIVTGVRGFVMRPPSRKAVPIEADDRRRGGHRESADEHPRRACTGMGRDRSASGRGS